MWITKKSSNKKIALLMLPIVALVGLTALAFYPTKRPSIDELPKIAVAIDGEVTINNDSKSVYKPKNGRLQAKPKQNIEFEARPISVPKQPNAAIFTWDQSGDEGVTLEVRTKEGDKWSRWMKVEAEDGGKDGAVKNGVATTLVIADSIDDFQYRFSLEGSDDKPSAEIDISESALIGIDSRQGPTGEPTPIEKIGALFFPTSSAANVDKPTVISREAWGSPKPRSSAWTPEYAKLKKAVVHHTATAQSSNSYADVRAIWHYHAITLGWDDIGYHYLVDSKGRIFEGRLHDPNYARANRVEVIGGHAYDHNVGSIGVSAIGNFEYDAPTSATLQSIARVIGYKMAHYGISPRYTTNAVVGHNQVGTTACPGKNIISRMSSVKYAAQQHYATYLPLFQKFQTIKPSPMWMKMAVKDSKYDINTMKVTQSGLAANRHIKFEDTTTINGDVYYRTENDAGLLRQWAIPLASLTTIDPEPITNPQYLSLSKDSRKIDPITDTYTSRSYAKGTTALFVEKIQVNGLWYYKTATDQGIDASSYFPASAVGTLVEFSNFSEPRYMRVNSDVYKVDPFNGSVSDDLITAGTDLFFDSKITTNQEYYRSVDDSSTNTSLAIPSSSVRNIPFVALPNAPVKMKLVNDTSKYYPRSGQKDRSLSKSSYPTIDFTHQITVNGTTYYQTATDSSLGNALGVPLSDLAIPDPSDLPPTPTYQPLDRPRNMTLQSSVYKKVPTTGKNTGKLLDKGRVIKFTTKIQVNGTWYLRTDSDTKDKYNKGIEQKYLK